MITLQELGCQVAARRKQLGLKQIDVAKTSGVTAELLSRFERGHLPELGSRKLIAVLAALGMEISLSPTGSAFASDEA
ncbi:Predicted DNA-binding protein, contains XRE-type HTH domain [Stenotrophomonas indicatrix]|uniref:Predicted DNA-binding protein, contains XRE-type HTH domain n=1 Tax=Stenotrophomonas indicatrix TaxID=2045451 RepID=A0A1W1H3Y4_9GAMM|nr:Predicted DNA-binding protein, contains XRE-type HTH domain [Stenotrophomonas indicatrix]